MTDEDQNTNTPDDEDLKTTGADEDPDGNDADEDANGGGDDEGGSQDDDKQDGSSRAQQRIKALTAKRKEAEGKLASTQKELDELKSRYGDAAPELFIKAAEKTGVLPSLISKGDAKGLTELAEAESQVKAYRALLRNDPDATEFTVGSKELSRNAVQAHLDEWMDRADSLKDRFGSARKTLQDRAKQVFELGLQAEKAGWKPGQKAARTEDDPDDGKKDRKGKPPSTPSSQHRPAKSAKGGGADPVSVTDADSLAAFFENNG